MPNSFVAGADNAGAEGAGEGTDDLNAGGVQDDSGENEGGTEDENGAVTFDSRDDFVKAVNKIVKQRLDRNNKKYAPVVQERDTLKAKVEELLPLAEGSKTVDQKRDSEFAQLQRQIAELSDYRRTSERNELVRRIAKDKGLPEEFIPRIQGDDEDAITSDIEEFVELLPEKTAGTKVSKTTKPGTKDEGKGGGKGTAGGAGRDDEEKIDPVKLASTIGRYGRSPYVVSGGRS